MDPCTGDQPCKTGSVGQVCMESWSGTQAVGMWVGFAIGASVWNEDWVQYCFKLNNLTQTNNYTYVESLSTVVRGPYL